VVAGSCVEANTLTTAAVVRGIDGLPWLRSLGVAARLVGRSGRGEPFGAMIAGVLSSPARPVRLPVEAAAVAAPSTGGRP
jgi:hypothetical protein